MARYEFRCELHGGFEVAVPMGQAGSCRACPRCGASAVRVYAAPMLARTDPRIGAVVDRAERSASHPEIVRSPPVAGGGGRIPSRAVNPAWARLPRP
jgi:putative FmdB family regulatory protein